MTKVLVTGAGGFLGQYLVEQCLARGFAVRTFCRGRYAALERPGVETRRGDLRDAAATADACRGMDVVLHVAAVAGIWGPWQHFYEINVRGTQNVLAGCRTHGVPRLVYTSSPSVTFDGGDQCGVDESAPYPTRWLCHYSHTKALAEQAVLAAHGTQGLQTCALRPHLIWGPRDTQLIPRLIERARRGQLRRVGDGSNQIDMIYVENAALAHLQAADALAAGAPCSGRAYFISQGAPVNCWQWIDEILHLVNLPSVQKSVTFPLAWGIGALCEWLYAITRRSNEPPMTRFLAAQLAKSHWFDITAARQNFGFTPWISTAEGMQRLATWLRGPGAPH